MIYNILKYQHAIGDFNWLTDDIRILLVNQYSINIDSHQYVSDIINYEVTGGGYTSGGISLINKTITRDDINDRIIYAANDALWNNMTISASGCVIYKRVSNNADSYLITYKNFGSNKITNNTPLRIVWSLQEGILYLN